MTELGQRAVVFGASMGGLLAARVLADFYRDVTVVERDVLPSAPVNRRGVPQGRQIHAIQARGTQILEELFPDFSHDLRARGVVSWDDGDFSKMCISVGGHQLINSGNCPSALSMSISFVSRPFLEWSVRRRVQAIPNVTILEDHDVVGLTATPAGDRVTGARIVERSTTRVKVLTADLVVDATGRGSRTPNFLEDLGYGRPPQEELMVHLAYAGQQLRIAPDAIKEHMIALFPAPGRPKMFGLSECENGTWMFAVGAMAGLDPPGRLAEMLQFAADFAPPRALQAIQAAEPLGDVAHHRVPSNRWRRYDKMRRTPDGLLVFGDAICSFNPIYGQGMTVAAIEATVLRDCLRRGDHNLPRRFFRGSAKNVRIAWQTAVGADLTLPEVVGPRPFSMRITNTYLKWVLTAAETEPTVAGQFMRVIGMIDPPARLVRPSMVLRIARTKQAHRRHLLHNRSPHRLRTEWLDDVGVGPKVTSE